MTSSETTGHKLRNNHERDNLRFVSGCLLTSEYLQDTQSLLGTYGVVLAVVEGGVVGDGLVVDLVDCGHISLVELFVKVVVGVVKVFVFKISNNVRVQLHS